MPLAGTFSSLRFHISAGCPETGTQPNGKHHQGQSRVLLPGHVDGQLCLHSMRLIHGQQQNVKGERRDFNLIKEKVGSAQKYLAAIAHLICGGCARTGF